MIAFGQHHQPESPLVKDLIEEAIEATGGREQLLSYSAITWQEHGVYMGGATQIDYVGDYAVQFPNRYRMRVKGAFTIIVNDGIVALKILCHLECAEARCANIQDNRPGPSPVSFAA